MIRSDLQIQCNNSHMSMGFFTELGKTTPNVYGPITTTEPTETSNNSPRKHKVISTKRLEREALHWTLGYGTKL